MLYNTRENLIFSDPSFKCAELQLLEFETADLDPVIKPFLYIYFNLDFITTLIEASDTQ